MFQKQKRVKNPKLIELVKSLPCTACRRRGISDAHHVTTRGAGGSDTPDNLMPLCRVHHSEWHMLGISYMVNTYQNVYDWLIRADRSDILRKVDLPEPCDYIVA